MDLTDTKLDLMETGVCRGAFYFAVNIADAREVLADLSLGMATISARIPGFSRGL